MSVEETVQCLGGDTEVSKETCLSTTLSTTNPTWLDMGSVPGFRSGKPTTNLLIYGTARVRAILRLNPR
jgi:hypothetical protein